MRDHLMGYGPAAREDFEAPCWWDWVDPWPCGRPARARDWNDCQPCDPVPRGTPRVTAASSTCMTKGDVVGLQALEDPQPAAVADADMLVTAQGCISARDVYTKPQVLTHDPCDGMDGGLPVPRETEPATLSPGAMWPFAAQGFSNRLDGLRSEPQACEAEMYVLQHAQWREQRRLEMVKAAEHERWLAQEKQRRLVDAPRPAAKVVPL